MSLSTCFEVVHMMSVFRVNSLTNTLLADFLMSRIWFASRDAIYVLYPHRKCRNAFSEGTPQAKIYQLHLKLYNTVVSQLLRSTLCFSLLSTTSQKTAACRSKHLFAGTSSVLYIGNIILNKRKRIYIMIKDLSFLCRSC